MASIAKRNGKWRVRWRDESGAEKSKQFDLKGHALKFKAKVEHELAQGTYLDVASKTWEEFREQYEADVVALKSPSTQSLYRTHLDRFEEVVKPKLLKGITTATIDTFIAKRSKMIGEKKAKVSPATINAELRTIRAALRRAAKWKCLQHVPEFNWAREPDKLPRFLTEEHFDAIYQACNVAKRPTGLPYEPADWWRGLLVFLYFTGWRISEPQSLRRADVDLANGTATTRHHDNKGKADAIVPLNPIIVDHLESLQSFHAEMFPWPHGRKQQYIEWHAIQDAAGIHLDCPDADRHECNSECHHYGFHDLRRAFATVTGADLTDSELRTIMRHRDLETTQRYINMRERVRRMSTDKMKVPSFLEKRG